MGDYPFRFYGAYPNDWFEGACCGHSWEVEFLSTLDAEARQKLAGLLSSAESMYQSIDIRCCPCSFSGSWLLITMGEQALGEIEDDWEVDPDANEFWLEVEDLWRMVHRELPIVEIHFRGVREPGSPDEWSSWSVARKSFPGPAPKWPGGVMDVDYFGRGMKRFKALVEEDQEFELSRSVPVVSLNSEEVPAWTVMDGRIVLSPAGDEFAPRGESYQEQVRSLAEQTVWSRPIGHGRFFALELQGSEYAPAVVDVNGIHQLDVGTAPGWYWDISCDGQTLLLARGGSVFRVHLDSLKIEKLPQQEGEVYSMADFGEQFAVQQSLKTGEVIDLLRKEGDVWQRQSRVLSRKYSFFRAVPGRRLLVATDDDQSSERPGLYLAVAPDGLRLLGTSAFPVQLIWEQNDQLVILSREQEALLKEFISDDISLSLVTKRGDLLLLNNLEQAMTSSDIVHDLRGVDASTKLCVDSAPRRVRIEVENEFYDK